MGSASFNPAQGDSADGDAADGNGNGVDEDRQQLLSAAVYGQLRRIAQARLASQAPGHTLQATALVHEAFLKMRQHPSVFETDRAHFFRVAAEAMRQILV